MVGTTPPAPTALQGAGGPAYQRFHDEVARRQLASWLPAEPSLILDLGDSGDTTAQITAAGHTVVGVHARARGLLPNVMGVEADTQVFGWLRDGCMDAVVADGGALSGCLATEQTLEELHRVLRPGGRLLVCVDSLVHGLGQLAGQSRWAELADAPGADVVLVPHPDGGATRCFSGDDLTACLQGAGFTIDWMRPRTVLSRDAVERAVAHDPDALRLLVVSELELAEQRAGNAAGASLVASAVRS